MSETVYAGFWIRTGAALIDTVLILLVLVPLLTLMFGSAFLFSLPVAVGLPGLLFNYVLPAAVVILFWVYKSATPGKMLLGLRIVDAQTGGKPSTGQLIGRYLGYYVSTIPLMLGIIWVGIDSRKQGWHDKLAGTLVVRNREQASVTPRE